MIEIDGLLWLVAAILICGAHALYLRAWRRERRQDLAWWKAYDERAGESHAEFMRALAHADQEASEGEGLEEVPVAAPPDVEIDAATQKILDEFDAYTRRRAREMLVPRAAAPLLQATRETAFRLGYKAGVFDLGAAFREGGVAVSQMHEVIAAAVAWRDSPRVDAGVLAGSNNVHEARLAAAVDAARAPVKESGS